jgi:hypothetical protein
MAQDDVEKFLAEQKSMEQRKQALIDELLKQKAAAVKEFDDKLAKLGHTPEGAKGKRSHHPKRPAVQPGAIKAKEKAE